MTIIKYNNIKINPIIIPKDKINIKINKKKKKTPCPSKIDIK